MLLPVRHTTAPRTPGQFTKVSMVLEKYLHDVAFYFRFQVKREYCCFELLSYCYFC